MLRVIYTLGFPGENNPTEILHLPVDKLTRRWWQLILDNGLLWAKHLEDTVDIDIVRVASEDDPIHFQSFGRKMIYGECVAFGLIELMLSRPGRISYDVTMWRSVRNDPFEQIINRRIHDAD